jgi:hypothetical protein
MWADRSESIVDLAAAWVQAAGEMTDLVKDKKVNTGKYGYTYADLGSVLQMARPVLARHGLLLTQAAETTADEAVVSTTILHASGQWVTTPPVRLPAGGTPQQTGSAITYARRYSALAALGLATEDDDAQTAVPRRPQSAGSTVEAEIRRLVSSVEPDAQRELRARFTETFGSTLAELPPARHPEALEAVRVWLKEAA